MPAKIPKGDETEMNMTPMIDIVFQLIVFFLLTLKFKSVAHRIESELPKDRGIQAIQQSVTDLPMLTVKLFRKNVGQAQEAFTRVRVGQDYTIDLPAGEWSGETDKDLPREKEYAKQVEQVISAIQRIWAAQNNNPEVKGEIKTPSEAVGAGSAVPHGDVVRILDAFLRAGITDVKFEGSMSPLPVTGGP
jgi:biopolymer transport protein ExbD